MHKIKLITDTGSDIAKSVAQELDILVLPFGFLMDGKQYDEYNEVSTQEFYDMLRAAKSPLKTAQITPQTFCDVFEEALDSYDTVIYVSLSSRLSATYDNAVMARNMVLESRPDADLIVLDSRQVTFCYGIPVMETARRIREGMDRDRVVEYLTAFLEKIHVYFAIDTLTYLKAGGRIGSTKLLMGMLLDVKPIMKMQDGYLVQFDKVRGSKNVIPKLVELTQAETASDGESGYLFLHTDAPERARALREAYFAGQTVPEDIPIGDVGCIIGGHGGPGIIGIVFWKKDN